MKKSPLLICLLTFGIISLQAQQFNPEHLYPIETSHSYINFVATYMGYAKVRGSFANFYGSIYYDPAAPDQTSVSFQVDIESIDTNNDWRDRDLKSGNWFLVEEYPHLSFISEKVEPVGEKFKVTGDLTIKSTTKRISFKINPPIGVFQDIRDDDQIIFTGSYALNRKEYGVMGKNWSSIKEGIAALADEVVIEFSLLGKQMNAANFSNFFRSEKAPHGNIYKAYRAGGLEEAFQRFEALQSEMELKASALNMVAYRLMKEDADEDALAFLERNLQEFPDNANVYDSMGEWYAGQGKLSKAAEYYRKALEMNEDNFNAVEVLKHLDQAWKK